MFNKPKVFTYNFIWYRYFSRFSHFGIKGVVFFFSKFSFLFHLENYHSKDVNVKFIYLFIYNIWWIARLFPTVHYALNLRDVTRNELDRNMERRYDFRCRRKPKCLEKTCAGKYGSRTKFTYDSNPTGNRTWAALVKGTGTTAALTRKSFGCEKQFCVLPLPISYCVSSIMVTITSKFSFISCQIEHFSDVKFGMGDEKNMTFLVIQKLPKVGGEKKIEKSD